MKENMRGRLICPARLPLPLLLLFLPSIISLSASHFTGMSSTWEIICLLTQINMTTPTTQKRKKKREGEKGTAGGKNKEKNECCQQPHLWALCSFCLVLADATATCSPASLDESVVLDRQVDAAVHQSEIQSKKKGHRECRMGQSRIGKWNVCVC